MVASRRLHLALGRSSRKSRPKVVMKLAGFPPARQRSSSRVIPHLAQAAPYAASHVLGVHLYLRWSSVPGETHNFRVPISDSEASVSAFKWGAWEGLANARKEEGKPQAEC
jgi:hypothetical protein